MLGSHLQTAAHVVADEFFGIGLGGLVHPSVVTAVEQQVVAHAAADETLLHPGDGIDGTVEVDQTAVVGVEVGADARMPAAEANSPPPQTSLG